jgi:acetate---CoA ligase (ADP-forming)
MNATFAPIMPPAGPVSFMSQSGAMGVTILDYAAEYGIGVNHFVSVGNKADVSGNDLIEYWADDPATRVILMYLENFGNPRRFTRIARHVTKSKPVIAVKAGSHGCGRAGGVVAHGRWPASTRRRTHCSASAASSASIPSRSCSTWRWRSAGCRCRQGNRVAVVTNAGGPGIIITDACESRGLTVAELSPETQARLRVNLPEEASVRNPVDMIATATPESYRLALEAVLADPNVDAAIAAFVPPLRVRQRTSRGPSSPRATHTRRSRCSPCSWAARACPKDAPTCGRPACRATSSRNPPPGHWPPCTATGSGWSGRPVRSAASTWTGMP